MINFSGLTGRVVTKDSPDYNEARQNYNARFDIFPLAIVYCANTLDVVNAIIWVRRNALPFRIRSGGHSYEAYSLVNNGLVIDVSNLLDFQLDKTLGTVRIGAGYHLSALDKALARENLVVPIGTCPNVGISGLTLGGGVSLFSRLLGLTCDQLLEVEMVMATGEVIRVNHQEHSSLFWACCGGGGGNYGVVTSLTFRVHPLKSITYVTMTWDFSDLKKVVRTWQAWAPYTDYRLTSTLLIPAKSTAEIRFRGVFVGSEEELIALTHDFQTDTSPKSAIVEPTLWIDAVQESSLSVIKQQLFKNSSAYADQPLSDTALDIMLHNLRHAPGNGNVVALDACRGAISEVHPQATAFVHRNALFLLQYQAYWLEGDDADSNIRWTEGFRESMLPFTQGAYRNYCDALIPDWPIEYYGKNLTALKAIKKIYDPENFFNFPQSIPL